MSKEADAKAGLLGKVAKFIKNPTLDWAEVDRSDLPNPPPSGLDAESSRLALKEMIKRKRRNDLVRKREFDMLRKIRRKSRGQSDDLRTMELSSAYSSSQMAHDAEKWDDEQKRERTLRQIDEIEAQLSRTWFRKSGEAPTVPMKFPAARTTSKPGAAARRDARLSRPGKSLSDFAPATIPTGPGISSQPQPPDQSVLPVLTQMYRGKAGPNKTPKTPAPARAPRRPESPQPASKQEPPALDGVTVQMASDPSDEQPLPVASPKPKAAAAARPATDKPKPRRRASVYKNALEDSIEVVALRQDTEIEEAAINFANGDEVAAELMLLKLVSSGGSRRQDVNAWLTLFDLYRVTGKSDAFDGLVPEFTTLFGRSAPQWERAPDPGRAAHESPVPQEAAGAKPFTWVCPAQFNAGALAALTEVIQRAAPLSRIDWRAVQAVALDVLPPLNQLLTQWAGTPVQLQMLGSEQLLAVLTEQSPAENKTVNPAWWHVRLTLLRLMGAPELFDQTALDYCITYEISPPAWTPPLCHCTLLTADGQPESALAAEAVSIPPTLAPTATTNALLTATGVFKATLEGEILGSAGAMLALLPEQLEHVQSFDLDCRALRRLDFGAAGELLNWSIDQQGQGRAVTFRNVHRLLAAFLSVMGVNAVAQVLLRKD